MGRTRPKRSSAQIAAAREKKAVLSADINSIKNHLHDQLVQLSNQHSKYVFSILVLHSLVLIFARTYTCMSQLVYGGFKRKRRATSVHNVLVKLKARELKLSSEFTLLLTRIFAMTDTFQR